MSRALSAAEDEQLRNVRAFMFERFRMVGDWTVPPGIGAERSQPTMTVELDRLSALASAVRLQLLRQVEEADLTRDVVLRAHMETVPISQEERERDLRLIMSQAYVNVELAAISYLEAEGDVVDAIMALNEGTEERARLVEGLRQRQLQLGLRVTEPDGAEAFDPTMTEERREVLSAARRALERAADAQHAERMARLGPQRDATRSLQEVADFGRAHPWSVPEVSNTFVDGAPIVYNRIGGGKSDRGAGHRGLERQAIRSEMEALEAQVEACTIDENTYNEKAMALKGRFEALDAPECLQGPHVASHYRAVREWLRENAQEPIAWPATTPPVWHAPPSVREPPEEVD